MEEKMKRCSKCGDEKLIKEFEKGPKGKHTSRCKKCAAGYASKRKKNKKKEKQNEKWIQVQRNMKNPLFGELPHPSTKVQRIQMLPGDTDPFVEILLSMWKFNEATI